MEKVQECWSFDHPRPDVVVDSDGMSLSHSRSPSVCPLLTRVRVQVSLSQIITMLVRLILRFIFLVRERVMVLLDTLKRCFTAMWDFRFIPSEQQGICSVGSPSSSLSWYVALFRLPPLPAHNYKLTPFLASVRSFASQDPLYLPANSELDVQIWRMTDSVKRRVWFEWSASAYLLLPSSTSSSTFSPPTSAASGTFPGAPRNGTAVSNDTLSPRGGGSWGSAAGANRGGGAQSPFVGDAFQSAPSPMVGQGGQGGDRRDSGRMQGIEEEGVGQGGQAEETRVLINLTKLHNPGGRASFVGL